jgi:predicted GIY-YIG superfamily endonuclease
MAARHSLGGGGLLKSDFPLIESGRPAGAYVYILQSISRPDQFYTGLCSDVEARLAAHNAGQSPHTSKYRPWKLLSLHYFERRETAAESSDI